MKQHSILEISLFSDILVSRRVTWDSKGGGLVTFVWSDLVHRDAAAVEEREHDFGDAVVAQPPPGITSPLILRLGHHSSHCTQERTVQVLQQALLLGIAVHVHAISWVRFTEAQKCKISNFISSYAKQQKDVI